MDLVAPILFLGLGGFVIWALLQHRSLFVVYIKNGRVLRWKGNVPGWFREEVAVICQDCPAFSGSIRGVAYGKNIRLLFSRTVPGNLQQRFRNAWCLH